jgi:hypothetical protein
MTQTCGHFDRLKRELCDIFQSCAGSEIADIASLKINRKSPVKIQIILHLVGSKIMSFTTSPQIKHLEFEPVLTSIVGLFISGQGKDERRLNVHSPYSKYNRQNVNT